MAMKIYTKTGDAGQTGLFGGLRLSKSHPRVAAYGAVDELNAHVGFLFEIIEDPATRETLFHVQNNLFTIGGMLAKDPRKKLPVPVLVADDITRLELAIDTMEETLPPIRQFI